MMIVFFILEFFKFRFNYTYFLLLFPVEGSFNSNNFKFNFLDFSDSYKKEDLLTIFFTLFFCLFLIKFIYSFLIF